MFVILVSSEVDKTKHICYGLGGREPGLYKSKQQAMEERDRMEIDFQDYPEQPKYTVYQLTKVV